MPGAADQAEDAGHAHVEDQAAAAAAAAASGADLARRLILARGGLSARQLRRHELTKGRVLAAAAAPADNPPGHSG